jgi:surface antigen
MILGATISTRIKFPVVLLMSALAAGCTTTSGSSRLDQAGQQLSDSQDDTQPADSAYYIRALNGGLVSQIPGLKLSKSDRARALEAEYKVLEATPSGDKVVWDGDDTHGEVVAAPPYQVGSQNCRQYSHSVSINSGAPMTARGAACRNANGSWTPLS